MIGSLVIEDGFDHLFARHSTLKRTDFRAGYSFTVSNDNLVWIALPDLSKLYFSEFTVQWRHGRYIDINPVLIDFAAAIRTKAHIKPKTPS